MSNGYIRQKLREIYHSWRRATLMFIVKMVVNVATIISVLFYPSSNGQHSPKVAVFLSITRHHVYLALLSMLSLYRFLPSSRFFIINDDTLQPWHVWLYKHSRLPLIFVSPSQQKKIHDLLAPYPNLQAFYDYGWSGKKFVIPLVYSGYRKIIMLDGDTLFYRFPKEIAEWIENRSSYHCYLKDYLNFSVVSPIEAQAIMGKKPSLFQVNSGLLCFDRQSIKKQVSFSLIDQWIRRILHTVKMRMTYDYGRGNTNDFIYVFPLLEQTIHWFMLSLTHAIQLRNDYFVFPEHKFHGKPLINPIFIHFTGEARFNLPMYKYLGFSLMKKIIDVLHRCANTHQWFVYSTEYCPRCRHTN